MSIKIFFNSFTQYWSLISLIKLHCIIYISNSLLLNETKTWYPLFFSTSSTLNKVSIFRNCRLFCHFFYFIPPGLPFQKETACKNLVIFNHYFFFQENITLSSFIIPSPSIIILRSCTSTLCLYIWRNKMIDWLTVY